MGRTKTMVIPCQFFTKCSHCGKPVAINIVGKFVVGQAKHQTAADLARSQLDA